MEKESTYYPYSEHQTQHLEHYEVFELAFQEVRFMALLCAAFDDDLEGNKEAIIVEIDQEIQRGKEEIASVVGYNSYAEMLKQVQRGSEEFYRIVEKISQIVD